MSNIAAIDWMAFLEKFGWPALVLGGIAYFFYKKIWPSFSEWLKATEERTAKADTFLREQIISSEIRNERITQEFLERNKSLSDDFKAFSDRVLDTNDKTTHELGRLADAIERLH